MFKYTFVLLAAISCAVAKPGLIAPVAYSAPLLTAGPGIVTATSNQVIARNYNGIASAPLLAAPLVAAPLTAAPLAFAPAAYAAPLRYASAYAAAPLAASYVSPLGFAAASPYLF